MKRIWELLGLVMLCSLVAFWMTRTQPDPPVAPRPSRLSFNGIFLGQTQAELEQRLGPPDYRLQPWLLQWEKQRGNFTRVAFDGQGRVKGVEGVGQLSRGTRVLAAFGQPKREMLNNLGEPIHVDGDVYSFNSITVSCSELVGMITLGDVSEPSDR
ncbi:MAG: hypothetical protein KC910_34565 [Candidatus Eremiobacteraeota bacterium]|nr:hypothetical protein [Candidatus Eremiobacteraeota bacterium]